MSGFVEWLESHDSCDSESQLVIEDAALAIRILANTVDLMQKILVTVGPVAPEFDPSLGLAIRSAIAIAGLGLKAVHAPWEVPADPADWWKSGPGGDEVRS